MANGTNKLSEDDFLNLVSDQFPKIMGQVEEAGQGVFDDPGLSAEEKDRLNRLNTRAKRLQPIDFESPDSTRIPGNQYSYDISPAIEGAQSVVEGAVNAVRQNRMEGDPEQVKKSRKNIEQAEKELTNLEQQAAGDIGAMGDGAGGGASDAVHGDRRKKMQQLRSQIESETQKLRDARGVQGQRANLLEKKKEGKRAEKNIQQMVADISPRVAQSMFDRQETQQRLQTQHDLTTDEIVLRHKKKMEQLGKRYGEDGDGPTEGALDTLSENVNTLQSKIQSDLDSLRTEKLRLERAKGDEQTESRMKERLSEDQTIDGRIDEIETKIENKNERLTESTREMIDVAAARNDLDKATTARLLGGVDAEELGYTNGDNGSSEGGEEKVASQADLEELAENYYEGDIDKARKFLKSEGFTIQGN